MAVCGMLIVGGFLLLRVVTGCHSRTGGGSSLCQNPFAGAMNHSLLGRPTHSGHRHPPTDESFAWLVFQEVDHSSHLQEHTEVVVLFQHASNLGKHESVDYFANC